MHEKSAAIVIIGNEILTGKTEDKNASFMIRELHQLGVALRRIVIVPDESSEIARAVRECAADFDYVFTSGGVGPTHDDVTIEGVAQAFGRRIVRLPDLAAVIKRHFGPNTDEARLRMADAPEGAELIYTESMRWPVLSVENVYVFPGVPEIFRAKFEAIRDRFREAPYHMSVVFTREDEFDIASRLNQVAAMNPKVQIGSYPSFENNEYRVKITVEANEAEAVERAYALLLKFLDPKSVIHTE